MMLLIYYDFLVSSKTKVIHFEKDGKVCETEASKSVYPGNGFTALSSLYVWSFYRIWMCFCQNGRSKLYGVAYIYLVGPPISNYTQTENIDIIWSCLPKNKKHKKILILAKLQVTLLSNCRKFTIISFSRCNSSCEAVWNIYTCLVTVFLLFYISLRRWTIDKIQNFASRPVSQQH